jgi:PAS domain-containing protein
MKKQQHFLVQHSRLILPFVIAGVLFIAVFVIRGMMLRNLRNFHQIHYYLAQYQEAGQLLQKGSDILTNAVRKYTVTLDHKDRDDYFKEANQDKHREQAFKILATLPGGPDLEAGLKEAMNLSQELMMVEYHAMRLIAPQEDLNKPDCPMPIRDYPLDEFDLNSPYEKRIEYARELVFGRDYENYKDQINRLIDNNFTQVSHTLAEHLTKVSARQWRLYACLDIAMIAMMVTVIIIVRLLQHQRERSNTLMRNILDNMPVLLYIKNGRSGHYIDANAAFLKFADKQNLEEIIDQDDYAIFDKHTAKNFIDNDTKALLSRGPITFQDTVTAPNGTQRRFRVTQFYIDHLGVPCVFALATDLTASEEANSNASALAEILLCLRKDTDIAAPIHILKIIRERTDADYALITRYDPQNDCCLIEKGASIDRYNTPLAKPIPCSYNDLKDIVKQIQQAHGYVFSPENLETLRIACLKQGGDNTTIPKCATMIAFPIFVHHELWGNLSLAYKVPHQLSNAEKEFGYRCSEILEFSLERLLHYRKLQDALDQALAVAKNEVPQVDATKGSTTSDA